MNQSNEGDKQFKTVTTYYFHQPKRQNIMTFDKQYTWANCLFLIAVIGISLFLAACSPAANQKISADLAEDVATMNAVTAKVTPALVAAAPGIQMAVDIGLAINGLGAVVPLNNAGVSALLALQAANAAKTGLSDADAAKITNAAVLGIQLTGNKQLIAVTPQASAALVTIVNSIASTPIPVPAPIATGTTKN